MVNGGGCVAATGVAATDVVAAMSARCIASMSSSIDTSDGLGRALEIMSDLNPGLRVEIDLAAVTLAPGVREAATELSLPPEAFLLGSAGEYELIAFLGTDPAPTGTFHRIGSFGVSREPGLCYRLASGELVPQERLPDPRETSDLRVYREQIVVLAKRLSGTGGGG